MSTIRFKNGDVYTGDVNASGQPHGEGNMDYKLNGYYGEYDGHWENGERSGKGHYKRFSKGGGAYHKYDYDGEWLHDKQHGEGVEYISDEVGVHLSTVAETYTGTFREGKRHGHGVLVSDGFDGHFANGKNRFEGEFENGKANGPGVMDYANGDRYEGLFLNDYREGPGKFTLKDGLVLNGQWKEGRLLTDTITTSGPEGMPILIVTEHHSGFDYNRTGTFLIPVTKKKGLVLYEDAVILRKDSSFDMAHTGLELISVTDDSITFVVGASFTKDSKPIEVTIHRGESVRYEDSKDCTATIYDEDYDYTIESYLEVSWK